MSETRKIAAILLSDVVGYSRLLSGRRANAGATAVTSQRRDGYDNLRHHGRVVKRTGNGSIVQFHSVMDEVS